MPESPSFLEQFDRSGLYAAKHAVPPARSSVTVFSIALLAVLVLGGIGTVLYLYVFDHDSKSVPALLAEGLEAHVDNRLVDAADAYRDVLVQDPTNKYAHYNLGLIAQTQGRSEEAEASYRRALETDPSYVPAMFNLAILRKDAGDLDEAIELYQQVIGLQPDNAKAHLNLGFALRAAGRSDEGDEEIARAIAIDPVLRQAAEANAAEPDTSSAATTTSTSTPPTTAVAG